MKIFMLWSQGWEQAPELCRRCADSWVEKNPDHEVVKLDDQSVEDYLPDLRSQFPFIDGLRKSHQSDIIRALLLQRHGGVWADATLFCLQPVSKWLPDRKAGALLTFTFPWSVKMLTYPAIYKASSWFLYSEADGYCINKLVPALKEAFAEPQPRYFTFHKELDYLITKDKQFRNLWAPSLQLSGYDALAFQTNKTMSGGVPPAARKLKRDGFPVFKLTYKGNLSNKSKVLDFLEE